MISQNITGSIKIMSLLARYKKGEHIAVWKKIESIGDLSQDNPQYADVVAVVEETMKRIRHNVEILHRKLLEIDYRFVEPDRSYMPPAANVSERIAFLEEIVSPLPLVIKLWLKIVGGIDFRGSHPTLAGYYPLNSSVVEPNYRPHDNTKSFPYYSDPMYIQPIEDIIDEAKFTQTLIATGEISGDNAYRIMFPDYFTKNNISGSLYYLPLQSAQVDIPLLHEPHETTWIRYIRLTFDWGGFPGFHLYASDDFENWHVRQPLESTRPNAEIPYKELRYLSADLLSI